MSAPRKRARSVWALIVLVAIGLVVGVLVSRKSAAPAPPAATPPLPKTPSPRPPAAWLGLDYNSESKAGSLADFAVRGIVYDREGALEVGSGNTLENHPSLASGLAAATEPT